RRADDTAVDDRGVDGRQERRHDRHDADRPGSGPLVGRPDRHPRARPRLPVATDGIHDMTATAVPPATPGQAGGFEVWASRIAAATPHALRRIPFTLTVVGLTLVVGV